MVKSVNRSIDESFLPSVEQNEVEKAKNPALDAAALKLANELQANYPMHFSVGHDEIDTIYVYEHVRGYAKMRRKEYEGFKIKSEYIGKIVAQGAK